MDQYTDFSLKNGKEISSTMDWTEKIFETTNPYLMKQ